VNAQPTNHPVTETPTSVTPPPGLRRLLLTGFMGAGKSTIGRLLAARLNWDFLDLDASIEARTGLPIPSIFDLHGEARFRQLESEALASALGRNDIVLALGGGAPEVLTNRLLIEQTPATSTIFLDAPFATLYDRCILQSQLRPVLADPVAAEARFQARHPLYRRLAQHTIVTASLTTEETVDAILGRLNSTPELRHSARPPRRV
jgi:shikimate kinase